MKLSPEQRAQFDADGYLLLPSLLTGDEVSVFRREIARLGEVEDECIFREGGAGVAKSMFRMHEPDGPTASPPFAALARTPRVLGVAQQVLGDEALYLHHTKVNMKGAIEGSVWPWHQDFGARHLDGIAEPDLVTVMIMLDDATEFSGCLYFLPGSHRRGRVDPRWDDSTAYKFWAMPPEKVRDALAAGREPAVIAGAPGDAVVFHCNLLHASGHNLSPHDRWQAYFCFNRVANRPHDIETPRPDYVRSRNWKPLELVADDAVLESVVADQPAA